MNRELLVYTFLMMWTGTLSLECYVCDKQQNNHEKCLNTIAVCEQGEEMCMTEVFWGTMPYWQQGADKQYYVSKKCATKDTCKRTIDRYMPLCTYIWYQDWVCSQCCSGDRCNYHVILGASSNQVSKFILASSFATVTIFYLLYSKM